MLMKVFLEEGKESEGSRREGRCVQKRGGERLRESEVRHGESKEQ